MIDASEPPGRVTSLPAAAKPSIVLALRRLFLVHRTAAIMIGIAALALRLLVPAGYMVSGEHGRIGMALCSNMAGQSSAMAMSAMHGGTPDHGRSRDHGKVEMPCAFSSLSAQALGGIDPILVVAAIAFFMVTGLQPARRLTVPIRLNLWPPLRGPPISF